MNILKYVIASYLLGCFSFDLQAAIPGEEVISIESELADYDGEEIILHGNAKIEHLLGTLTANHMTLQTSKKKGSFGLVNLRDHVKLAFKDGGVLSCGQAEFNYQTLAGRFSGNKAHEFVTFVENNIDKCEGKSAVVSLVLKSLGMSIQLAKNVTGNKAMPKNNVSVLIADEKVTINYNDDFLIAADRAVYQRIPEFEKAPTKAAASLPGVITLTPVKENTCRVSNKEGCVINADQISINTVKRQLNFSNPKGILRENVTDNIKKIDFSAKKMVWDDLAGVLTLREQVDVHQQGIGSLKAQEVRFHQYVKDQKKTLKTIEALGDAVLIYREVDKDLSHTLTCPGVVKVDHEKMETRLLANDNASSKKIVKDQQVHFEDAKGEIFADKVLIRYTLIDGSINISKIFLVGNVKIYNRLNSADDETVVTLQYVLADRVDFTPSTNEMLFKSLDPGGRVLFFDKTNHLQVSAPALKIIRDKATEKDSIKGFGDVRFSFLDSEFEQLCKRFSLYLDNFKEKETVPAKLVGD